MLNQEQPRGVVASSAASERKFRAEAFCQAVAEAVAGVAPYQLTTVAEFVVEPTTVDAWLGHEGLVFTRVRVSVTRYGQPRDEEEAEGYVKAEVWAQPTKVDGTPDKRTAPAWRLAPDALAAELLLAAMTTTLIPR